MCVCVSLCVTVISLLLQLFSSEKREKAKEVNHALHAVVKEGHTWVHMPPTLPHSSVCMGGGDWLIIASRTLSSPFSSLIHDYIPFLLSFLTVHYMRTFLYA